MPPAKNPWLTPVDKSVVDFSDAYRNQGPVPGPIPARAESGELPPLSNQMRSMLPAFLQSLQLHLGKSGYINPENVAEERPGGNITVDRPGLFSPGVLAHEATHAWTESRQWESKYKRDDYDYGGLDRLRESIANNETINSFSIEQQAEIVKDWYELNQAAQQIWQWQGGYLTPSQADYYEGQAKVYNHFIAQLAGETPYQDSPDDVGKGEPKQRTPGLPPASVVGFAQPIPEYGGPPMRVKKK